MLKNYIQCSLNICCSSIFYCELLGPYPWLYYSSTIISHLSFPSFYPPSKFLGYLTRHNNVEIYEQHLICNLEEEKEIQRLHLSSMVWVKNTGSLFSIHVLRKILLCCIICLHYKLSVWSYVELNRFAGKEITIKKLINQIL